MKNKRATPREQRQNESQKAAIIDVKGYAGEDLVNCLILNLFLIVSFLIFIKINDNIFLFSSLCLHFFLIH